MCIRDSSICGSENIDRKKDSKWLINIRDDAEFSRILEPAYYYFVLFEPIENHSDVQVSIWQADPKTKGFAYMLMDYYLNIRPASESHACLLYTSMASTRGILEAAVRKALRMPS